jgi:hypothetical protein
MHLSVANHGLHSMAACAGGFLGPLESGWSSTSPAAMVWSAGYLAFGHDALGDIKHGLVVLRRLGQGTHPGALKSK